MGIPERSKSLDYNHVASSKVRFAVDTSQNATVQRRHLGLRHNAAMKMRKKADLPTKTCARCGLPFTWRKKWERDWDNVKFCSERCRRGGTAS